jgi:hypothetical protein
MLDQARADRISLDIQQSVPGMFFFDERGGVKTGLPEMAHAAEAEVHGARVIAVDALEGS